MDNLLDKARNLSQSTPSAKVAKYVGELESKYGELCGTSKQMLDKLEASVKDHQQYQDMYQDCQDWLNSSREKVELCADTSGDKLSLQNKLERLKVGEITILFLMFCFQLSVLISLCIHNLVIFFLLLVDFACVETISVLKSTL